MRRVLLAGDLHGECGKLHARLDEMRYDPRVDALVLLGDLTDRGPESQRALEWIGRPNVHRILGNHCVMPGMLLEREISAKTARKWGGGWFVELADEDLREVSAVLRDAPAALTVHTPAGRDIGLVHADCSADWTEHVRRLEHPADPHHEDAVNLSLWRRDTIDALLEDLRRKRSVECCVTGVDHVFHGHTPMPMPFTCGDRTWLDTGACYGDELTVIDADMWLDTMDQGRPSP